MDNFDKFEKDITIKKSQKDNDKKAMEQEIESLKKRIESDKMETESIMNSLGPRKKATEVSDSLLSDLSSVNIPEVNDYLSPPPY